MGDDAAVNDELVLGGAYVVHGVSVGLDGNRVGRVVLCCALSFRSQAGNCCCCCCCYHVLTVERMKDTSGRI